MDATDFFKGKKITLMGLGLLGRGVGDARFLAECGALLTITDQKTSEQLAASVEQLKEFPNVTFHLGGHTMEDFENCDLVVKAAGVPLDSPYIEHAIEHKVPVVMSTALMAEISKDSATIVGVTGTRGKSTVTQMIYDSLVATQHPNTVHLGGNIRGVSTLALLPHIKKGDIVVLELDSWQLQGFGDLRLSPNVAVFTNLMSDHLNYYHGDMDLYFADKAHIFLHQKPGDTLIVGANILERVIAAHPPVPPVVPEPIPSDWVLKIPGQHNRENAALARRALNVFSDEQKIRTSLTSFEGVPGRLQFLKEIRGVKIYNDNNATTPDATIAALRAFGDKKNIILITGGSDKGLDMSSLVTEIPVHCKKVLLLGGAGTDRIKVELPEAHMYADVQTATVAALKAAESGDILLFSPAFASFGMFKNEYDRHDQFVAAVEKLGHA